MLLKQFVTLNFLKIVPIYNTICAIKTYRIEFFEDFVENIYNTICAIKTFSEKMEKKRILTFTIQFVLLKHAEFFEKYENVKDLQYNLCY